jgi:integrase
MEVNFYIEQKGKSDLWQIQMMVTDKTLKPRVKYYSERRIDPKEWNKEKQKARGTSNNSLNSRLDSLRSYAIQTYDKLKHEQDLCHESFHNELLILDGKSNRVKLTRLSKKSGFIFCFEGFIKKCEDGTYKTRGKTDYSPGTIENFRGVKNTLIRFSKETGFKLDWQNINDDFYDKFTTYLWDDLKCFDGWVGQTVAIVKKFLNFCVSQKILQDKLYSENWKNWKEDDVDALALMPEEIQLLYKMPIPKDGYLHGVPINSLYVNDLEKVKDNVIFGCLTCLRVANLLSLKEQDLVIQGNKWSINPIQVKIGKPIWIRLHSIGIAIIKKYRHKYDTLLPSFDVRRYDECLKDLAYLFRDYINSLNLSDKVITNDWNTPFTRTRYKRGKAIRVQVDICDMMRSHTVRTSGITTLLIMGMREFEVKKISGHSKDSKSFGKYIRIAQKYVDVQSDNAWDKVFNTLKVG